jgi:hypothetical protein
MPSTKGKVRSSRGNAIFRCVLGLPFIGMGVNAIIAYGDHVFGLLMIFTGVLFSGHGAVGLIAGKKLDSTIEMETCSTRDRLDQLDALKAEGRVSVEEYAAKRQEILKDL